MPEKRIACDAHGGTHEREGEAGTAGGGGGGKGERESEEGGVSGEERRVHARMQARVRVEFRTGGTDYGG